MGTFFKVGKDKAVKGEGWALPFISRTQDTVGLTPTAPTAIRLGKPLLLPLLAEHIKVNRFSQRETTFMTSCLLLRMQKRFQMGLLLEERICSLGSKFFPIRDNPYSKRCIMKMHRCFL